jgi:hypothetical protein
MGFAVGPGMPTERTTIPVTPETRDEIKNLKRGGEDYESVVRKLLSGEYPAGSDR